MQKGRFRLPKTQQIVKFRCKGEKFAMMFSSSHLCHLGGSRKPPEIFHQIRWSSSWRISKKILGDRPKGIFWYKGVQPSGQKVCHNGSSTLLRGERDWEKALL